MRRNGIVQFAGFLIFIFGCLSTFGQTTKTSDQLLAESGYYASIRYVIVYNKIFDGLSTPERRIRILMDEKQFSKTNLIIVFDLLEKRFSESGSMAVEIHTNLATIETPEEEEMTKSSNDRRFSDKKFKYKSASYLRFDNGKRSFFYSTKIKPYYEQKLIKLPDLNN